MTPDEIQWVRTMARCLKQDGRVIGDVLGRCLDALDAANAERDRLRINHLRRMAGQAECWAANMEHPILEDAAWATKHRPRLLRFAEACRREIDRMKGKP